MVVFKHAVNSYKIPSYFSYLFVKKLITLPVLLGLLISLPKPGRSEVFLNLDTKFYSVDVERNAPLFPQLLRASPIIQQSSKYTGYTSTPIKWNFKYRVDDSTGQCRIVSNRTELNTKMTMPQIYGGTDRQITAFNRFYNALLRHELGHYDIAAKTAFAIDYELTAMPAMQSCGELEQAANDKAYKLLQIRDAKDISYDEITRHGRLQGAVLNE
jgi:predicted secreted Zn-dependent protease